jgi:hypothetical protein
MNFPSNIVAPALVRCLGVDNPRMTGGGARMLEIHVGKRGTDVTHRTPRCLG